VLYLPQAIPDYLSFFACFFFGRATEGFGALTGRA
jgi:hypothetical protein